MGMRVHAGEGGGRERGDEGTRSEGGGRERGNEGTRRPVANMGCVVPAKVCVSWKRCVCLVVTGGDGGSQCSHRLEALEPEHNSLFLPL